MGINYVHNSKEKLLVVVWDGVISVNDWQAQLMKLFADPEYEQTDSQLVDLRLAEVDESITNPIIREVVKNHIAKYANRLVGMKLALIAEKEWQRAEYVGSLFSLLPIDVVIFYQVDAACQWLRVDIEEVNCMIAQLRLKYRSRTDDRG